MEIDRYEIRYNAELHKEEYYAVSGKKKYRMPDAFKGMYTNDYLAIEQVHNDRPEVFGIESEDYYIPRRTAL